ncbi:MAG: hypothetical protein M5R41_16405 [Bacteroidia bacterium]|nr:hypothetical protein [Bacteroidia bacterium]
MKNILFICGSINQTTQMHAIARELPGHAHYFTPYYSHGFIGWCAKRGFLEFSILGAKLGNRALEYLRAHDLRIDMHGQGRSYDLVLTCSDLIIPRNIRHTPIVLVQEGMTDPKNVAYYLAKYLKLPRWMASTSTTGLSHAYRAFCVASEGYREMFLHNGVRPGTLRVTGIPNFDNCAEYRNNDFPHRNFVLVATSDMRETFKYENRVRFIRRCLDIAQGRQLIFKLHPNEHAERATKEIQTHAPGALVYATGNINHMIANCDVLVTRFSSVVYIGLALEKEVYSDFDVHELRGKVPIQNGGSSAAAIAVVCREILVREALGGTGQVVTRQAGTPQFLPAFATRIRRHFGSGA